MEPATRADLKVLLAEFRSEFKQAIKESIAEVFGAWKPAAATDPLDLAALKACSMQVLSRDTTESSSAPAPTTALHASTTPPTAIIDDISVLVAAAASGGTFDEEAITATPAIVERGPEVVLPASTGFTSTAPTTCSMEGLVRETADSRSASASTTVPTMHTVISIDTVLAASTTIHGALNGQAISGVALSPATCSIVCLPRHRVAAPVLAASPPPAPTDYVLDINRIHVAVVPLATTVEFLAVAAPTDSAPKVQLQQLDNDSEFFMLPTSSQCLAG